MNRFFYSSALSSTRGIRFFITLLVFTIVNFLSLTVHARGLVQHQLWVSLNPEIHRIKVEDRIVLPASLQPDEAGRFHFILHKGLDPHSPTPGVIIHPDSDGMDIKGIDSQLVSNGEGKDLKAEETEPDTEGGDPDIHIAQYTMSLPVGLRVFVIQYQGQIDHPVKGTKRLGAQREKTLGTISSEGIFLSGRTHWVPRFSTDLFSFVLNIVLPPGWNGVSQGERTIYRPEGENVSIQWESPDPQEEIFMVGGKWTEYHRNSGRVPVMVFLRTPDEALAKDYLKVTEQYLEMYHRLIGPYPYKKFALVENFWEAGFSMPSFALLGPKKIRFPLILHSSYPHEILHNWWGHGVYVGKDTENWSEGLTIYLADYLIQEQSGKGVTARRAALQKYTDYVSANKDSPLTEFRFKQNNASQAIGSGKTAFLFHTLRHELGDETFIKAIRTFYHDYRFKRASFNDLLRSFNRTSGKDLFRLFSQWTSRKGAPTIRVRKVRAERNEKGFQLTALIQQRQPGPAYSLNIPIALTLHTNDEASYQTRVSMKEKELELSLTLPARPIRMTIDPEFDLFRRLYPAEMPPSLSKVFRSESVLIVLPSTASEGLRQEYQKLAESWRQSRQEQIEVVWDDQLETFPADRDIWLFGWKNRFQKIVILQLQPYGFSTNSAMTRIAQTQIPRRNYTLVVSARNPSNRNRTVNWLATDNEITLSGLNRELAHYGAFGYLGFEGSEPKNIVKGRWPIVGSPMSIRVTQADRKWIKGKKWVLSPRSPLVKLPQLLSEERIARDVSFLSNRSMKGRGFGSPSLDRVAEYIAASFRRSGLKPGGESARSYLQQWKGKSRGLGSGILLKNVVGFLPGYDPKLKEESIVVGAHYDHLGFGWPRVSKGDEGKLHPGANENASGAALLLELARILGKNGALKRSIVFVAFTAKEVDFRGSMHFISEGKPFPSEKVIGMLNLDTVGQLGSRPLIVLGGGSAREWPPLLREAGVATGVTISPLPGTIGTSDHVSFIKAGIPAIQIFGGMTAYTGRPTDTIDKIDLSGIVKAGRVAYEMIEVLSSRPLPLTFTLIHRTDPTQMWKRRTGFR